MASRPIKLTFQTVDATRKAVPFTAGVVIVERAATGGKSGVLFSGYPDSQGSVRFTLPGAPRSEGKREKPADAPKLTIQVLDLDREVMLARELDPKEAVQAPILVDVTKLHHRLEAAIGDGVAILGVSLKDEVAERLKKHKVTSLAGLRFVGPTSDSLVDAGAKAQLRELEAHAELHLVCRDVSFNRRLIAAGYPTVEAISRVDRVKFIKSLRPANRQEVEWAGEVYDRALRLLALAANKAMERKVGIANRRKDAQGKAYKSTSPDEEPPCGCSCGSAVSPLAYLADLLDYAVRHVRENGNPLTMARLGQRFHQPFEQLPLDCSGSETLVRQVRLCVEVLRRKAAAEGRNLQSLLQDHALRTYETLLAELGVSYSELRRARAASPERRTVLAERLGITEPQLDRFILFPPISEPDLEKLFGFTATEPGRPVPASSVLRDLRLEGLAAQWQAADELVTVPLIDPDVVDRSWFTSDPAAVNAAEARFEQRAALLEAQRSAIKTFVVDQATLEKVLTVPADTPVSGLGGMTGLGFRDAPELDVLNAQRLNGKTYSLVPGVALDLSLHGVTRQQLDQLLITRELAAHGNAVGQDWDEAAEILVSVDKRRRLYPVWKAEEQGALSVSPHSFRMPEPLLRFLPPSGATIPYLRWRFDLKARRDWLDRLSTRIEQSEALITALSAALDHAEEAVIPRLRDDLIAAVVSEADAGVTGEVSPSQALDLRRKWVTNQLLINAYESGCRLTTRIAQATESLQLLIWGVRTGLMEDARFSLDAPDFDGEWKWLGTYASWRGAMWVFLYPENLLNPGLRKSGRTKAFETIVSALRGLDTPPEGTADPGAGGNGSAWWPTIPPEYSGSELSVFLSRLLGSRRASSPEGVRRIREKLPVLRYAAGEGEWGEFRGSQGARFRVSGLPDPVDVDGKLFLSRFSWGVFTDTDAKTMISFQEFDAIEATDEGLELRTDEGSFVFHAFTDQDFVSRMEDILYLPLQFAHDLGRAGEYAAALEWYASLVDTHSGAMVPEVEAVLDQWQAGADPAGRDDGWLGDPLNPHWIARSRKGANERYILLSLVRCLIEYAESEFAKDTAESIARARELYLQALQLLDHSPLAEHGSPCPELRIDVGDKTVEELVLQIGVELGGGRNIQVPVEVRDRIKAKLDSLIRGGALPPVPKLRQAIRSIVKDALGTPKELPIEQSIRKADRQRGRALTTYAAQQGPPIGDLHKSTGVYSTGGEYQPGFDPGRSSIVGGLKGERYIVSYPPSFTFCIPPNPLLAMMRLRATAGLYKLSNCMNAAGLTREVPAYSAPTDTTYGVPVTAAIGTIQAPPPTTKPPTLYRYRILIERARQLQGYAQQLESTYFSYLQGFDAERFSMLRAQQDLGVTRAQVRLQDLRKDEARHQYDLAELQWQRADFIREHYQDLIDVGLSNSEQIALQSLQFAALASTLAISVSSATGNFGGSVSAVAEAMSAISSFNSLYASYERREEEWKFQRDLAELHDMAIADQQKTLAQDHIDIVDQEWGIAKLTADHAGDVVQFLNDKFTSAELYGWMAGVVGGVYRYMLQQATSIAKLAQQQLAFERQEPDIGIIRDDYWTDADSGANAASIDRRGMTGAERLLGDITKLDQHAFLTEKRKLQLTKTISLARMGPLDFQRFRQTGVLPISLSHELFDRDFPGHYLRLVKRIRVSVIALVPPVEGIKATLTSLGTSRVVRGGETFEEVPLVRRPETVALTSPLNATGLFELQEQPEMLLPFEGMGVAGTWELRMPRASNALDYDTIADVLFTMDYTALHSDPYRKQVVQSLDTSVQGDRVFSFRHQFADAWYDLNHPELLEPGRQMKVALDVRRADFQPNLVDGSLKIRHVTLFFARKDGSSAEVKVNALSITDAAGAPAVGPSGADPTTVNGMLSTREGPGTAWSGAFPGKSPLGMWQFTLEEAAGDPPIADRFRSGEFTDILLVITYDGETCKREE